MANHSDDDEQTFIELIEEEEADADAADEEHLQILTCLAGLYAEKGKKRRGGSRRGRRKCKPRQRAEGYCLLYADYFADVPLQDAKTFRRRFRMKRELFNEIWLTLWEYDPYFKCKKDCTGMLGFSAIQKCTVAMRLLAYGTAGYTADDYLRMVITPKSRGSL